jgi:hypothetical protein
MRPGGDFRHYAAIRRMRFILAEDDIGQDQAGAWRQPPNHGGGGFVATGFQA